MQDKDIHCLIFSNRCNFAEIETEFKLCKNWFENRKKQTYEMVKLSLQSQRYEQTAPMDNCETKNVFSHSPIEYDNVIAVLGLLQYISLLCTHIANFIHFSFKKILSEDEIIDSLKIKTGKLNNKLTLIQMQMKLAFGEAENIEKKI